MAYSFLEYRFFVLEIFFTGPFQAFSMSFYQSSLNRITIKTEHRLKFGIIYFMAIDITMVTIIKKKSKWITHEFWVNQM